MKARLPIFSCNLALALIANVLCVNVLYYSCKCRLFYFCPNYLLLNFGKLFSGRHIRRSAQSVDAQQNSHFQSCKNTNSESGLTIDNQRITRCTQTSPLSTTLHITVLRSISHHRSEPHSNVNVIHHIPHQSNPPYFTPPFSGAFHVKVIHHISHHRSPEHFTSKFPTTFHITVPHHIPHHIPHQTFSKARRYSFSIEAVAGVTMTDSSTRKKNRPET